MKFLATLIILVLPSLSRGQQARGTIQFPASDSLMVTADEYLGSLAPSYIILLHGEQSSRGEFSRIAPRLVKFHYHCLAVDLRTGKKYGYVKNKTAETAREEPGLINPADAEKDILGAIRYAWEKSEKPVILMGNASSASLALLIACKDPRVQAVIALSPGEYFKPFIVVRDSIQDLHKPVFAAGSTLETGYLKTLFEKMEAASRTIFTPETLVDYRGTEMLTKSHPVQDEYWLSLIFFFNTLRKNKNELP